MFPTTRLRRLRRNDTMRRMVRETSLSVDDLILPLFVRPGTGVRNPIASMDGQFQLSVDTLVEEAKAIHDLGVPAVILFGIPESKDASGSASWRSAMSTAKGRGTGEERCADGSPPAGSWTSITATRAAPGTKTFAR